MRYAKEIGTTLAETLQELFICEELALELDEIRDPKALQAAMARAQASKHPNKATHLKVLQGLHTKKLAVQARHTAVEDRMGAIAKTHGYSKAGKGKFLHKKTGHALSIGPGHSWSHTKAGSKRSIGHMRTPRRDLGKYLAKVHG